MLALALLLHQAAGDIPVHCLIADFAGSWVLHLGEQVEPGHAAADVPDFARGDGIENDYCFSGHPNKNSHNVKMNIKKSFENAGIGTKKVFVDLTENITVRDDHTEHMVAHVDGLNLNEPASWTTAYDEGWELRAGPQHRFFALAQYRCADSNQACGQDGAGEDSDGSTVGYKSECGQTLVGWYHNEQGKGCFYGEKVNAQEAQKVHSFVLVELAKKESKLKMSTAYHHSDFKAMPSFAQIMEYHKQGGSASFKTTRRAGGMRRMKADTDRMKLRDQCHGDDVSTSEKIKALEAEHPHFDWREQFGNRWNTQVMDQGGCGSCYAIAMTYVLQSRANIMRLRELEKRGIPEASFPDAKTLSPHSVLSCSYYNQGCDGGYPYLVAKHAADFGIPTEECQPYGSAQEGVVKECPGECYQDQSKLVFAENYNYAGGFYGVCGQYDMMKSLLNDGPLVIALEVPIPFNSAQNGHVVGESYLTALRQLRQDTHRDPKTDNERASPMDHHRRAPLAPVKMVEAKWKLKENAECATQKDHAEVNAKLKQTELGDAFVMRETHRFALNSDKLAASVKPFATAEASIAESLGVPAECVDLDMVDGTMNGWEYTNHAITLVGWGEQNYQDEDGEEQTMKYWIIRNSWGEYYGDQGYAYVLRGQDYAGIESQAVDIKVDRERGMMKKWLDEMPSSFAEKASLSVDAAGNIAAA